MSDLLVKPETTYNLRLRTEVGRSSFKHRAALSWNFLPDDIKTCSNLDSFTKKLEANKSLLNSISFTKASCRISNKSRDFKYFFNNLLYFVINLFIVAIIIHSDCQ